MKFCCLYGATVHSNFGHCENSASLKRGTAPHLGRAPQPRTPSRLSAHLLGTWARGIIAGRMAAEAWKFSTSGHRVIVGVSSPATLSKRISGASSAPQARSATSMSLRVSAADITTPDGTRHKVPDLADDEKRNDICRSFFCAYQLGLMCRDTRPSPRRLQGAPRPCRRV